MLEFLSEIDRAIFLFINVSLANPVTDCLMPVVTSDNVLRVCYGAAMVIVLWRGDKRLRWLVLFSLIAIAIADQLSAGLLKPLVGRPRPCHVLENINLLVGCGGGRAMPSAHAANSFAVAGLFGILYRSSRVWLFGLATLIALSRVFVGVHYPGDIIVGALLGLSAAIAVIWLYRFTCLRYLDRDKEKK